MRIQLLQVSSILSVMMQHLLYKWPKGALSNQDQKFYQSIKQAKEHPNESPPPHPREVSITVYNPTEAPVTLLFYSPHRSPGSETETVPLPYSPFFNYFIIYFIVFIIIFIFLNYRV